jgi:hypothetical protein
MARGGRRWGAGRPGWRRRCEDFLQLDIRQMHRVGRLNPGSYGWEWISSSASSASVCINVDDTGVTLTYTLATIGGNLVHTSIAIALEQTPCNFGGGREWFKCPACRRRCAIVYGITSDGYFACRRCLVLAYSSESEDLICRLWRKQYKLERRLGDSAEKPKWMRFRTFDRIVKQIHEIEKAKRAAFIIGTHALRSTVADF